MDATSLLQWVGEFITLEMGGLGLDEL